MRLPGNPSLWAPLIFCALLALVLPGILSALWIKVFTSAAVFSLAAIGIAIIYAQLGLINLSQITLVGIGGWVVLRLNYATDLPFTASLLAGGLVASAIATVLALPALRLRGLYLALVTLMAASAFQIVFNAYQFPNGGTGFWGVAMQSPGVLRRPGMALSDPAFLRYTLIVVGLGITFAIAHRPSRPGRAWAMIRQSEANAMAAGVNVTFYKLWAFALSGLLAGIAGGLLAGSQNVLDARSFVAGESILFFALVVVGGVYHWTGAIIAGLLYKFLPALLNNLGLDADLAMILFGVALLHAIMTAPEGISGQLRSLLARLLPGKDAT